MGKLIWWNPAIFIVKLLSRTLQQLTGGIDGAQLWDEAVQFSQLVQNPCRLLDLDKFWIYLAKKNQKDH